MTRGDLFQAKATLQSIMENYLKEDEVKAAARDKLATITELESASDEEEAPDIEIPFDESPGNNVPAIDLDTNDAPNNDGNEE